MLKDASKNILITLVVLSVVMLISGCIGQEKPSTEQLPTTRAISEWKSAKADPDLVKVVNFLMSNKGKEIELAGEKHKITGKEEIDVVVKVPGCCETMFNEGADAVSIYGTIKDSSFEEASIHASVPADEIPKMEGVSSIYEINFEPETRDFWLNIIS